MARIAQSTRIGRSTRATFPVALASLIALVVLAACAQTAVQVPPRPRTIATPTETAMPLPSSVSGLLGPAPTNCPAGPPLSSMAIDEQFGGGFVGGDVFSGQAPVWNLGLNPGMSLSLESNGQVEWPSTKVMWIVGPDFNRPVTLSGHELTTGAAVWFSLDGSHPETTSPLLDPSAPNRGSTNREQGIWHIWGILIYFLHAGCYELDASWTSGAGGTDGWHLIVAAGR
ncbi:MAG TPA: hypothetical protein VFU88_21560 [Ktedonobacterales bacterium]|nr:hypothetical protein [Ktedonobacterales bacterium]